jgi:hypothetical protein
MKPKHIDRLKCKKKEYFWQLFQLFKQGKILRYQLFFKIFSSRINSSCYERILNKTIEEIRQLPLLNPAQYFKSTTKFFQNHKKSMRPIDKATES